MKILASIGSPRIVSLTYLLVKQILEVVEARLFDPEILLVITHFHFTMIVKDIMRGIYLRLHKFGIQVYWFSPTEKMKEMIKSIPFFC